MNGWGKGSSLILSWEICYISNEKNLCKVKFLSDVSSFENIDIELEL